MVGNVRWGGVAFVEGVEHVEGELSNFHLAEMPTVKFDFDR